MDQFDKDDILSIIKIWHYKRLACIICDNLLCFSKTNLESHFFYILYIFWRQTKPFNQFTKILKIFFYVFKILRIFLLNS